MARNSCIECVYAVNHNSDGEHLCQIKGEYMRYEEYDCEDFDTEVVRDVE